MIGGSTTAASDHGENTSLSLADQLRRERLLDIEERISRYRRMTFAVLALSLLLATPELGAWWLFPFFATVVAFPVCERLMRRAANPFPWAAAGWAVSPLAISVAVALTGGPESPGVPWLALPAITLAARFERQGVLIGSAYIYALLFASTVAIDPAAVAERPSRVIFPMALVLGAILLSTATVESDRKHRREALVDPLTGLLNRAALRLRLDQLLRDPAQAQAPRALAFAIGDIDRFKEINDTYGHLVGDEVLRTVARAMRKSLRGGDQLFRIGGEEFVALLPLADRERAVAVCERLRQAVAAARAPSGLTVTISFGVTIARGADVTLEQLVAEADEALYRAKRAGRDRVELAARQRDDPALAAQAPH
ncbi:putative diguanylate cyclase YcdT [bacterium HR41]|nr:putative diguanylate cyclase YcdT [bacterium HR41]